MSFHSHRAGLRYQLFATASLLALTGTARADGDDPFAGFWVSTGGAFLTANGTSQPLLKTNNGRGSAVGLPAISDRVHDEWLWQAAVGGPLGGALTGWDFKLAYTGIRSGNHRRAASTVQTFESIGSGGITTTTFHSSLKQGFDIGDFEIGQDVGLGGAPSHFFLGMRVVSFNQSSRSTLLGGEGGTEVACSHFSGAGPRTGLSSTLPFATLDGVSFSLTGGIDASAIVGKGYHKATFTPEGSTVTTPETAGHHTGVAWNTNAQAGVMIGLPVGSQECDLTLGYMVQGWWNVMDTRVQDFGLAGSGGSENGNQYLRGPFVNVAMKW